MGLVELEITEALGAQLPAFLTAEQRRVMEIVNEGRNCFFSGSAGSGKSTVLGSIVASLNREHGQDCVAVAAPSGIAACNIRGGENQFSAGGCAPIVFGSRHSHCGFAAVTVASFVGAGILSTEECKAPTGTLSKIRRNKKKVAQWKRLRALVIDEMYASTALRTIIHHSRVHTPVNSALASSMLDGRFFNAMEWCARRLRDNEAPFGGVQVSPRGAENLPRAHQLSPP